MRKFYRILFLGDFHYGESYRQAGAKVLRQHGYEYATTHLEPFIRSADYTVVNLETPIVGSANRTSPLLGRKRYLHWADENQTPYYLRKLGVDAAALANNHIMDQGQDGLRETLQHLSAFGIEGFGAGEDRDAANAPLSIRLPNNVGGGTVNVYSSFQYSKRHDREFEFYAKRRTSGCASLASGTRYELLSDDVYNVAFPHWGANYKWKTSRQEYLAETLAVQGFNVTIGHGSHSLQEIDNVAGVPTVYGIGNGIFQSGGRFAQFEEQEHVLPFGFWAMLEFSYRRGIREVRLKLYPVLANNKVSNYLPRPVTSAQHCLIYDVIKDRSGDLDVFGLNSSSDDLGLHLHLNLGEWAPPSKRLVRSNPAIKGDGDIETLQCLPERNRLDSIDDREILRQQQDLNRTIGTLITASEASRDGYFITWIDRRTALATSKTGSRLIQGHRSTEGSVAAAVVKDKLLTKMLLSEAGVKTPNGKIVSSADDAIRVWRDFGCPVVLKPRFGNKGTAVFVNLNSEEAISKYYIEVAKSGPVLLEEYLGTGAEYRCLATPEETVSTVMRVLPWVEGDGVSTVRELIVEKNNLRFSSPSTHGRYIPIDSTVDRFLARSKLSITSVLPPGVRVYVRDVGGLSSGGEPYEVSELIGDEITRLAARACSVVPGLTWCGADVLMTADKGAYIIEINTDADISGAVYPWYGPPKNVGSYIWSELKAKGGRILSDDVCSGMGLRERSMARTSSAPFLKYSNSKISEYLLDYVRELGGTVESVSPMLSKVTLEDGEIRWLRGCATEVDPAVPSSVLRSHLRVRRLLGIGRVLRVRGRLVRSSHDLPQFSLGECKEQILVPARRQWEPTSAIHARDIESDGHEDILKRRYFMQEYPIGTRLRVAAAPTEIFVIFGETQNVGASLLKVACRAAVNAIRCIPQLRFAFVDVVLREAKGGTRVALVEGISSDPVVRSEERVLYGDLERLWQFVLNTV